VDRIEDGPDHGAGDGNLGQLEGDVAGIAHDAGTDLDQLELKAGRRPVGLGLGQLDAAQEGGQVLGQRVQLQPRPNPPTVERSADRRRRLENKTLDLSEKIGKTFHQVACQLGNVG